MFFRTSLPPLLLTPASLTLILTLKVIYSPLISGMASISSLLNFIPSSLIKKNWLQSHLSCKTQREYSLVFGVLDCSCFRLHILILLHNKGAVSRTLCSLSTRALQPQLAATGAHVAATDADAALCKFAT